MLAGLFALVIAAAFSGAAFYINFAEHPARMRLPVEASLDQWRPSYKRGFMLQATLAVAGGALAIWQWHATGGGLWLAGGLVLLANWPFTLLVIMPTNRRLLAEGAGTAADTPDLLIRWNRLHAVRTLLGLLATALLFTGARG
jgi:hypothetical protein